MKKEDLIALGLSEEQADKVIAGFGTMVPKSRLDDKINEVKDLTNQLKERDTQLNDLKKIDAAGLQTKIEELQQQNETDKAEYEAKIKDTQLKSALKLALASKVHDTDLVTGLIDKSTIELDEEGNVKKGLDEQIKTLRESKAFLFTPETEEKPLPKGTKPGEGKNDDKPSTSISAQIAQQLNTRSQSSETKTIWD
ncbi:phage scaffolding protein [Lysinibacillus sp. ACHW1.5]|uniref:phage scaffolding protein n=1 Tax=Lysinibacillus sp. ACHW1.5 TaxID=2913506 RepID=UPI001EDC384B|nr:phage scaffolding protein [Lysinibacillus sp. ACHW1.5]UKJ43462.1 phage scaffolding protein [Lysinibacillus sp. ACHW1.5]